MSDAKTGIEIRIFADPAQLPPEWDEFVTSERGGSLFHTSTWQRVLRDCYQYLFWGLVAFDDDRNVVGVLPAFLVKSVLTGSRVVSNPFSYICGPVAVNEHVAAQLLRRLVDESKASRVSYVEVKSLPKLEGIEEMVTYDEYKTFRIDLSEEEEAIFKNTHKGQVQRGIKKARKEGIEIRVSNDEAGVAAFHRLNLITCRNHGIPAQPFTYHGLILRELCPRSEADYLLAYHGETAIAGIVVFSFGDTAVYMYGASDPEHLSLRPNHLLLWEAIVRAKQRGLKVFDLGRVSPDNVGLRKFKEHWGAAEESLHYYYWPTVKGVGSTDRTSWKYKLSTLLFSKLPISITDRLTWLYRHLG